MEQVKGTLNRVELLGWLGAAPDMRFTPSGVAICTLRIATKHLSSRNTQGERLYETDWTNVEVWGRLAERCQSLLSKGSRVLVTGSLRTDNWDDRETGQRRWKTFVRAEDVLFLGTRQEGANTSEDAAADAEDFAETETIPF